MLLFFFSLPFLSIVHLRVRACGIFLFSRSSIGLDGWGLKPGHLCPSMGGGSCLDPVGSISECLGAERAGMYVQSLDIPRMTLKSVDWWLTWQALFLFFLLWSFGYKALCVHLPFALLCSALPRIPICLTILDPNKLVDRLPATQQPRK